MPPGGGGMGGMVAWTSKPTVQAVKKKGPAECRAFSVKHPKDQNGGGRQSNKQSQFFRGGFGRPRLTEFVWLIQGDFKLGEARDFRVAPVALQFSNLY